MRASCAGLALAILASGAGAQTIGAVGAVNPQTLGEPPTAEARQLAIADPVVAEERIIASELGLAQLMFIDQTTLTVGPNSEVVLDRFVYDPETGAGDVAVTLARGALRFVGGRATKTNEAQIAAPGGVVIGLRGGMLSLTTQNGRTEAALLAGDYARITGAGDPITLARPGAFAVIEPIGGVTQARFGGVLTPEAARAARETLSTPGDGGYRAEEPPPAGDAGMNPNAPLLPPVTTTGVAEAPPPPPTPPVPAPPVLVEAQTVIFSNSDVLAPDAGSPAPP